MTMPSISRKGSPSISMRSAKVPLSPSSALQQMYFCGAGWSSTVFHLMPAGNPAPPRPRRPDSSTSAQIAAGSDRKRPAQAGEPAMRGVVVEVERVDHADAGEGQPFLMREIRAFLDQAEAERMLLAGEDGVEHRGGVLGADRAEADAALGRHGLDQRLDPEHAARAVADDAHLDPARLGRQRQGRAAVSSAPTESAALSAGT